MRIITLNRNNIPQGDFTNATYTYRFPTQHTFEKGDFISVSSINLWYSNASISSDYFNNQLAYYFPNGSGTMVKYAFTIDEGTYTIEQLNFFLQQKMISNGHYIVNNTTGDYLYWLELRINTVIYGFQLNTFPVPTSLPTGYSNPSSMVFPPTSRTPSFEVPDVEIGKILGMNVGIYPPLSPAQTTTYSKTSDFIPQISPVISYTIECSLVKNRLVVPSGQIFCFSPDGEYAELLSPEQHSFVWNEIVPGTYTDISIRILDQNFRRVIFKDPNNLIQLAIWKYREDGDLLCRD